MPLDQTGPTAATTPAPGFVPSPGNPRKCDGGHCPCCGTAMGYGDMCPACQCWHGEEVCLEHQTHQHCTRCGQRLDTPEAAQAHVCGDTCGCFM